MPLPITKEITVTGGGTASAVTGGGTASVVTSIGTVATYGRNCQLYNKRFTFKEATLQP